MRGALASDRGLVDPCRFARSDEQPFTPLPPRRRPLDAHSKPDMRAELARAPDLPFPVGQVLWLVKDQHNQQDDNMDADERADAQHERE